MTLEERMDWIEARLEMLDIVMRRMFMRDGPSAVSAGFDDGTAEGDEAMDAVRALWGEE